MEPSNTQDRRFIQGLGFDVRRVADAAHVLEADDARTRGHGSASLAWRSYYLRLKADDCRGRVLDVQPYLAAA